MSKSVVRDTKPACFSRNYPDNDPKHGRHDERNPSGSIGHQSARSPRSSMLELRYEYAASRIATKRARSTRVGGRLRHFETEFRTRSVVTQWSVWATASNRHAAGAPASATMVLGERARPTAAQGEIRAVRPVRPRAPTLSVEVAGSVPEGQPTFPSIFQQFRASSPSGPTKEKKSARPLSRLAWLAPRQVSNIENLPSSGE